jgi:hypothetical protein
VQSSHATFHVLDELCEVCGYDRKYAIWKIIREAKTEQDEEAMAVKTAEGVGGARCRKRGGSSSAIAGGTIGWGMARKNTGGQKPGPRQTRNQSATA